MGEAANDGGENSRRRWVSQEGKPGYPGVSICIFMFFETRNQKPGNQGQLVCSHQPLDKHYLMC